MNFDNIGMHIYSEGVWTLISKSCEGPFPFPFSELDLKKIHKLGAKQFPFKLSPYTSLEYHIPSIIHHHIKINVLGDIYMQSITLPFSELNEERNPKSPHQHGSVCP